MLVTSEGVPTVKVMESCRRSKVGLTEMPGSVFPDIIRSNLSYLKILMEAWWTHSDGCFLNKNKVIYA